MKQVFRFLGYLLGGLFVIIIGAAAWINFTSLPTYESKSAPVVIPTDSASLAVGKKMVETLCVYCHLGEDGKLSGRPFTPPDSPMGEIWSRNITQHPEKGIAAYTDGELAYLIRTGVRRNGEWAGPFMVNTKLSDKDLGAVIAYLRSDAPLVQPSESDPPKSKYGFLLKALVKTGAMEPKFYDIQPVEAPPATEKIAYGKYLATARYFCFGCHSASFETNDDFAPEKSQGYFGGGNLIEDNKFNLVPSANLTMSKKHGLGTWTETQFATAVRTGARPDGRNLSPAMLRFGQLDDEEISAIWAYLQTVPVLENEVARATK